MLNFFVVLVSFVIDFFYNILELYMVLFCKKKKEIIINWFNSLMVYVLIYIEYNFFVFNF